jgi:ABC-2 type transport system permease protein
MTTTARPAPSRFAGFGAALVLATKDLKVAWSYRMSFILGHFVVIGSILLFYFVSRVVGQSAEFEGSQDYFRFVIIGMGITAMIERSVGSAAGAARRDQVEGTLEAVASLPVSAATLGLGWMIYPLVDGFIGLIVMLVIALPFGLWGIQPDFFASFVVLILVVLLFSGMGLFGAALTLAFQQGSSLIALSLAAMGLISGALFPVSVMPHWLQVIAAASPLKHALDAFRATMLDGASLAEASTDVLLLAGFTVVILPASLVALEFGLRRARRVGGLSRF